MSAESSQYTADQLISMLVIEGDIRERGHIATWLRMRIAMDDYSTKVATVMALSRPTTETRNDFERMSVRA